MGKRTLEQLAAALSAVSRDLAPRVEELSRKSTEGALHHAVSEFAPVAEALCAAISNDGSLDPSLQLVAIHQLLPQVYAAALRLPSTAVLFEGESEEAGPTSVDGETAVAPAAPNLSQLAALLGNGRFYREVFDPNIELDEAPVVGDLLDDLADIHRDLAEGLAHWRVGNSGHALWTWRFGFEHHWAEHATSVMRALFALCAKQGLPWPAGAGQRAGGP